MQRCFALCLLLGACGVDLAVPPGTEITCVDGACPEGMVCRPAIGLCVPADAQNETPPDVIAASVSLSRTAIGVQVPLVVTFEVTEDLHMSDQGSEAIGARIAPEVAAILWRL